MKQENRLINQILNGEIDAFRYILERYERPVLRMIRNLTANNDSYEDVAQDVFFTAYRKLSTFDPARSSFSTWLFTIARNKSLNSLKKKKPISMRELPQISHSNNPSKQLAEKEFFDELDDKLQALPLRQRRAFVLAEFENLSYEQIAQIEGARIGTIKSRINRAKKKLRSALKDLIGDTV